MVMRMQNYLMIQNNVVTNVCVWDGNTETWAPPADATMLVQATTPALVWVYAGNDYELQEILGQGQIGFTWNGTECVTNEPKPAPQPVVTGTQEL
jgi:hypothetical protein